MELECSFLCSQEPATDRYLEIEESNPHPPTRISKVHVTSIVLFEPRSPKWSVYFGLSSQKLVHMSSPLVCAIWPAHVVLFDFLVLISLSTM